MTLRVSDLQSDSDLDIIRNSCDALIEMMEYLKKRSQSYGLFSDWYQDFAGFICMKRIFVSSMKTLIAKTIL